MLIRKSPTKIYFVGYENRLAELRQFLTFRNSASEYDYRRFRKVKWFARKFGEEAYRAELERLRQEIVVCLLKQDESGLWTYSGLGEAIANKFNDQIVNEVVYPETGIVPWDHMPKFKPRYFQDLSKDKLIDNKHAGVEIGTGLGKSFIIMHLAKHYAQKTVIMAPSISIARQLYADFVYHFGSKRVGLYGDTIKKFDKMFTIGIAASLTKIAQDSPAWKSLSKATVFIVDESHLCPADSLAKVCFGLCANAPYRFFFSGTQMRNDGQDLLLDGITGPIVYNMTVREGVDQGFLSKPHFKIIKVPSVSSYVTEDHQEMMQRHFYSNTTLAKEAAVMANKCVELLGHQVLILIEHIEQFQYLFPHLKGEVGFAHGGVTKTNKGFVPAQFHKSDPEELVKQFNSGKLSILVGTSCIGTGTDIKPCKTVINLQGGQSEVKIRQAIGRGTRMTPDKSEFNYIDFDVVLANVSEDMDEWPAFMRHAQERRRIYNDVYGPVEYIG